MKSKLNHSNHAAFSGSRNRDTDLIWFMFVVSRQRRGLGENMDKYEDNIIIP